MFSIHGLLRANNMELGRDADTGGQIKYVIELCTALSQLPQVKKVDLFTRLIQDKVYSEDYGLAEESISEKFRIIRLQCGGRKYIRKESLWPVLDEFVDKSIKFIRSQDDIPNIIHGHYADGGYVAKELATFFDIPFIYTAHSLGRTKKTRLLAQGVDPDEMNQSLKIDHRIGMEEEILKHADLVITSTRQEIEGQYNLYKNQTLPAYKVIPPGIGIEKFFPYYHENLLDPQEMQVALHARASITQELNRFFQYPDKPLILILCRPDKRKNIQGLIQAYGEDCDLQTMANLAVFAGIRKDISKMEDTERNVLTHMLLLMDKYNLYGKMAIPKQHDFEREVPELYRIAAEKKGVFVNPALNEPFGITLLEALACGLPVVATNDGGPRDIIQNCGGGHLVDPNDPPAIASSIRDIIAHPDKWNRLSKSGVLNTRRFYTWESHTATYAEEITTLHQQFEKSYITRPSRTGIGRRFKELDQILITDIDNTLLGGHPKSLDTLVRFIKNNSDHLGFGVATGRGMDSALEILNIHNIPTPDIIISEVGSCISYGNPLHHDRGWESHINKNWKPQIIQEKLSRLDFLCPQEACAQGPYKLSYYMEPGKDRLAKVHHLLSQNKLQYALIYSCDKFLDILPYRASKGKAIRYLSYKWEIPLKNFLVCGDSGNDAEMLKGDPLGVVVANYSPELDILKNSKKVYFAKQSHADGIMEGIHYFGFTGNDVRNSHGPGK